MEHAEKESRTEALCIRIPVKTLTTAKTPMMSIMLIPRITSRMRQLLVLLNRYSLLSNPIVLIALIRIQSL